jgi:putative transcriptional regulator
MKKDYLTGKCLVAMPNLEDERFKNTVVYLCAHNQEGAMCFIVNKQIKEFCFSDLVGQFNIENVSPVAPMILHRGGPQEQVRGFVLHSKDYEKEGTVSVDDKFSVSSSIAILNDIAFGVGPTYNLIALGYSSWSPKQLEFEIINNNWLVVDATPELLFKTPDNHKWQRAIDELNFDINRISLRTGRA